MAMICSCVCVCVRLFCQEFLWRTVESAPVHRWIYCLWPPPPQRNICAVSIASIKCAYSTYIPRLNGVLNVLMLSARKPRVRSVHSIVKLFELENGRMWFCSSVDVPTPTSAHEIYIYVSTAYKTAIMTGHAHPIPVINTTPANAGVGYRISHRI